MERNWELFAEKLVECWAENQFIKVTLSGYKGTELLKNIYIKKAIIKQSPMLSFTYRYKTKDIVKNYDLDTAIEKIKETFGENQFQIANLFSTQADYTLAYDKKNQLRLDTKKASLSAPLDLSHDKGKERKISSENKSYLHALNITDASGKVFKNAQDKYKQINHFVEILSSMLLQVNDEKGFHVADMGSGKGYLTFALYDYLKNTLAKNCFVQGVEYREDMVQLCNNIAKTAQFEQLNFIQGSIADYSPERLDMIIALHACDTATDDAIIKGIEHDAQLIVVAPCCHKQIRQSMREGQPDASLDFILKYGLFAERQAELITDSIRSLILEYFGYQTKIVDFIADVHTPKNVLIIAEKKKQTADRNLVSFQEKLQKLKDFWGISHHYLEQVLK